MKSLATDGLVFDPRGAISVCTESTFLVRFIGRVVTLEPLNMAVALKSQNVRGNAVKEPPVVADDHGAAGKFLKRLFKRP